MNELQAKTTFMIFAMFCEVVTCCLFLPVTIENNSILEENKNNKFSYNET